MAFPITVLPTMKNPQSIGAAIGEGLGSGLSALGELKRNELQKQLGYAQTEKENKAKQAQNARFWSQTLGLQENDPYIQGLAGAPEQLQKNFLDRLEGVQIPSGQQQGPQTEASVQQQIGQPTTGVAPQTPQQIGTPGVRLGSSTANKAAEGQLALARTKHDLNEKKFAYEMVKPEIDAVENAYRSTKAGRDSYERALTLVEHGDTKTGPGATLLKKLGLWDYLKSTDDQVLEQVVTQLAQGAAAAFGTKRLTNLEVELFKDSLISLKNSPDGIKRIARIKLLEADANELRDKALKTVRKLYAQTGTAYPIDIVDIADNLISKDLDRLKQQTINELLGINPKDYNKPQDASFDIGGEKWSYYDGAFYPQNKIEEMQQMRGR